MFNQLLYSLRKYFGISKRESKGILLLSILMIFIMLSPLAYNRIFHHGYTTYYSDSIRLDNIIHLFEDQLISMDSLDSGTRLYPDSVFNFDPNTLSFQHMITLGMDSLVARRIVKYRNNKGRFYVKKDLLRIYDFPDSLFRRLWEYILLPESAEKRYTVTTESSKKMRSGEEDGSERLHVDLNTADTLQLMKVYGIGPVLSKRIIKYRKLLGGYLNIDQLNDVYGLKGESLMNVQSAVYVDSAFIPVKISINFLEWEELVRHPYIDSRLASAIIQYRSTKGYIGEINALKDIPWLTDSILNRLEPYIQF